MGWLDDPEVSPTAVAAAPLGAAPVGWWEKDPLVAAPGEPLPAKGFAEHVQAGWQGSAPGLMWRGKLPDLVMNPATAAWWERLATGVAGVASDLPIMIPAGAKGAAVGTAVAGPVGGILAGGSAMFAAPAGIRTSLTEFYKARGGETPIDWFNVVRETAKSMLHEGAIGAATFGAGAVARGGAAALMGASGQAATAVGLGTATMATRGASKAAGTADVAAQIAAMVTAPWALGGPMPEKREFLDAAAVILTLKGAHVALERAGALKTTAQRIMGVYEKTGKTPAEQVQDAMTKPDVAADLTAAPDTPIPTFREQLTKQEELWTIQDRLGLLDRQVPETLTPTERAEADTLRTKVAALEAEGIKPEAPEVPRGALPPGPRYAPDQLEAVKETAARRIAELTTKEGTGPLTDVERAERIGLVNALSNPEALAKRYGIEPAIKPITDANRQASAQRVYDDVLRLAQENNAAREAAGLEPLGEDHAQQVAKLMRAHLLARATRLGVLPEDLYNERPLQIRDETQPADDTKVAVSEAAAAPELPRFVPPEVDLFGNPIEPNMAPRHSVEGVQFENVPVAKLKLSKDVPQFKHDADERGVVEPLGGEPDPTGWAVQVWERLNGDLEIISGRHRLELWERHKLETIPAQIHKESEGFTVRDASMLDAELNIRDQQGSVADYVQYFKDRGYTREQADKLGLLARSKGQMAFAIARDGTPELIAANRAYRAGSDTGLSPEAAFTISQAAPGSERLQNLGIAMVRDGKTALFAVNMMKAMDMMAAERMAEGQQGDLWNIDDSGKRDAAAMAKKAVSIQRTISEQISAVSGASKRPELARKMGVDVQDPEGIQKKIAELKQEQYQWDNWPLYPELVAKLRAGDESVAKEQPAAYIVGDEVRQDEGRFEAGRVETTEGQFDLFTPAPIPGSPVKTLEKIVVEPEQVGKRAVAFNRVRDAGEAASVFQDLNRSPMEKFQVLGLDAKDKPIAFFDMFAGTLSQTSVYPREVWTAIYQTPGIKSVWIAHQHPSGLAEPSHMDRVLTKSLQAALTPDIGVTLRGHLIITKNKTIDIGPEGNYLSATEPKVGTSKKTIPIMERMIQKADDARDALSSPTAARDFLRSFSPAETGLLVLDTQNRATGWWPMSVAEMSKLRTGDVNTGMAALLRRIGRGNADAVIAYSPKPTTPEFERGVRNIGQAVQLADVKMLDAFAVDEQGALRSHAEAGLPMTNLGGTFFQTAPRELFELKPETPAELKARDEEAVAAAKRKLAQERAGVKGPVPTVDQADLFNTQRTLFQTAPPVDSEPFKRWFGDSKVVDAEGKPLVVYHGTIADIESFDPKTRGMFTNQSNARVSFSFSDNPAVATAYAAHAAKLSEAAKLKLESARRWLEKHPEDMNAEPTVRSLEKTQSESGQNIVPVYLLMKNPRRADWSKTNWSVDRIVEKAIEENRDGVIIKIPSTEERGGPPSGTYYMVFHPTQIKSAIGNRGTFDPKDPNILYQDKTKPWYYSELARAVTASPMKQGDAKAWQDYIKSRVGKGVKNEEIEATGINDWLATQEGKVTKEQVQAFMEQGGVKVTETVLSSKSPYNYQGNEWQIAINRAEARGDFAEAERINRAWEGVDEESGSTAGQPKFAKYQLPGSVPGSYRELVLTLPEAKRTEPPAELLSEQRRIGDEWSSLQHGLYEMTRSDPAEGERRSKRMAEIENRQHAISTELETLARSGENATFESSHFPGVDYLANTRVNDRILPDGRKVLFVEEIQSDRAQKRRTEGFSRSREQIISDLEAEGWEIREDVKNPNLPTGPSNQGYKAAKRGTFQSGGVRDTPQAAWDDLIARNDQGVNRGIPAAPFVTKTDSWTALVLKRLLRYAAEGQYDAIAWTRGDQQVERYASTLRKAVDVIEWKKTPEGVQIVGYKGKLNYGFYSLAEFQRYNELRRVIAPTAAQRAEIEVLDAKAKLPTKVVDTTKKESVLSDAIGKSMADKIRNDPNQTGTIEGEDITVSDTGMAGYYDRIVPKVAQEVAKKVGGGKVVEIQIEAKNTTYDVEEGEAGTWFITHDGIPLDGGRNYRSLVAANRAAAKLPTPVTLTQQALEITPAMREKIMAGQQLFQKPGQERDGQHLGSYSIAENLITTFRNANKSTIVHELSHSWLEEMKADAARPDAPAQIKADWELIRREFAIGADGEISTASHEQFARTGERYLGEGVAPSVGLRAVFERFKAWMLEIYGNLQNLGVQINPEVRGMFDRLLATDQEIADAKAMDVPRAYVSEARRERADLIVQPAIKLAKIDPGFEAEKLSIEPYADEIPKGPGEAPDNSHINYAYINGPTDLKLAMQKMAEIDQTRIQQRRGGTDGVKSWAEARAEQTKYVEDMLGGEPGALNAFINSMLGSGADQPRVDTLMGIIKRVTTEAAKDSARLRDVVLAAGHDATVKQQLEYMGSIERTAMIHAEMLGQRAAIARAMNALKDTTEGSGEITRMLDAIGYGEAAARELFQTARTPAEEQAYMRAKLDEILQNYRGKTVLDIAKLHKEIGTLKGTFKFSKEVTKATKWEMVVEGWKAGMLSGPQTPVVNVVGTWSFQALRAPIDALAATIGMARGASPGMGESDRASMSEALARITGPLRGVQAGLKVAYHALKVEELTGKTETYRAAIPGLPGDIIRFPFRLMGAGDALMTTMYKRGELETLAIRTAFDEQLNPGTREFADRVQHLIDNPTPSIEAEANRASTRMTFNDPGGEKMRSVQNFVNKWNLQWVAPFIRTPGNIAEEMIRMTPFAPTMGSWRADIAKGGVARDKAIAEVIVGSGIMALTMAYAFDGQVTGSGDPDPGKNRGKAGVWQANSILVGDRYYEIGRLQPGGTLIVLAADVANAWDHMNDEERDKIPKILAMAFANAVTNQTMLQGITGLVRMLSEPDRYATRFFQSLARSTVPNIVGQPVAMADPYVREVNSMLEAIQSRTPWRQDLMPKLDWLGEPVKAAERMGAVLPVRELEVSKDKVRLEAARLDISMAAAPKKTHIGKGTGKLGDVPLTPEERNTFAKVGGEMAHKILDNIVNAPGYDQIPDLVKRKIFAKVIQSSHQVAAVAALPMDKRIAYIQSISEKMTTELAPEPAQ